MRINLAVLCKNIGPFCEFSLCLSRACLGKIIIFSIKWHKRYAFFYLASETSPCACLTARRQRSGTAQRRAPPSRAPYCSRGGSTDRRCRRRFLPHHHPNCGHARRGSLQKRSIVFTFSLCLSRVCLGKCSILRTYIQNSTRDVSASAPASASSSRNCWRISPMSRSVFSDKKLR
jgi:hypothetical protein